MTNKEAIERWAKYIVPSVFKGEDQLLREQPEWRERLAASTPDNATEVAQAYCHAIAEVIVKNAVDYNPDEDLTS